MDKLFQDIVIQEGNNPPKLVIKKITNFGEAVLEFS